MSRPATMSDLQKAADFAARHLKKNPLLQTRRWLVRVKPESGMQLVDKKTGEVFAESQSSKSRAKT